MYTLDQVLRPDFPRSWHEAVALVQEVADSLGTITTVPAPEEILVGEDGSLVLGRGESLREGLASEALAVFASEAAGDPVRGLGRLLLQLLEGVDAPAALQSLAADNAKTPPAQPTVAAFVRSLAFFERPDRRADLGAVAVRLSGQKAAVDAEYELQRLRERIASSQPPEAETPANAEQEERPRPRLTSRQAAMAAIIVIALMGTFAGVQLVRGSSLMAARPADSSSVAVTPPAPTAAAVQPEAEANAPAAGPSSSVPVRTASPPLAEAAPPTAAASQPPTRTLPAAESKNHLAKALPVPSKQPSQRSVGSVGSRPPVPDAPVGRMTADRPPLTKAPTSGPGEPAATAGASAPPPAPPVPAVHLSVSPLVSEAGGSVWTNSTREKRGTNPARSAADAKADALLARTDEPGRVYSSSDPEVLPARLLRSQLPQEPAADARTGYFELLVDESGDVEFVRLISPTHRYQDRILVAAAKAWKFKPATLHGRPVKYRLTIPIILREPR